LDATPIYDRVAYIAPWMQGLIVFCLAGAIAGAVIPIWLGETGPDAWLGPVLLVICVLPAMALAWRVRVQVTPEAVVLRWGIVPYPVMVFPLQDIEWYRVVKFRALMDFGGWGWRLGPRGSRCYNLAGNTGVELKIGGRSYIVGVPDPEVLANALRSVSGAEPRPPAEWKANTD